MERASLSTMGRPPVTLWMELRASRYWRRL